MSTESKPMQHDERNRYEALLMQKDAALADAEKRVEVYRECFKDVSTQNRMLRERVAQLQTQVSQLQDANERLVEEYAMNNPLILGKP